MSEFTQQACSFFSSARRCPIISSTVALHNLAPLTTATLLRPFFCPFYPVAHFISSSLLDEQLCLVYIIITYIHICLPCILLMLLVPVICFCLPCVIRVLGMLQGPQRRKGARQEEIEKLPIGTNGVERGSVAWVCGGYREFDVLCTLLLHKGGHGVAWRGRAVIVEAFCGPSPGLAASRKVAYRTSQWVPAPVPLPPAAVVSTKYPLITH